MGEPILTICLILAILYLGWLGATLGLFNELTNALILLFATLVALRYWHPFTKLVWWLTLIPYSYAAFAGFWALLLIVCLPLLALTNRVREDSRPKYPRYFDQLLGFVFGSTSAFILVCCLMTSASVVMPKVWDGYDSKTLLIPWDKIPVTAFRHLEREWLEISKSDSAYTKLPAYEEADPDDFQNFWQ